jgi:hypothetical protein
MSRPVSGYPTPEFLCPSHVAREAGLPPGSLNQIRLQGKFLPPNLITNVVQRTPQLGWDYQRVRRWARTYESWQSRSVRARLPHLRDAPDWWQAPLLVAPSFGDIVGHYEQTDLRRVLRAAAKSLVPAPAGKVKATYAWHFDDAPAVAAYTGGSAELDPRIGRAMEDWSALPGFPEQWQLSQLETPRVHQFAPRTGDPGACTDCADPVEAHRATARTQGQQLTQVRAELAAARAAMKHVAQDVQGLMYERGPDGLRLREFVPTADTNGDPEYCDARAWEVRGRLGDLLDWLDNPNPTTETE